MGAIGLAFLAGLLSILSPCVLPLIPIVIGTALSKHRLGPAAVAAGVATAFASVGLLAATIGFAAGLDSEIFRSVAAVLMVGIGAVLMIPGLEHRFALAAGPI